MLCAHACAGCHRPVAQPAHPSLGLVLVERMQAPLSLAHLTSWPLVAQSQVGCMHLASAGRVRAGRLVAIACGQSMKGNIKRYTKTKASPLHCHETEPHLQTELHCQVGSIPLNPDPSCCLPDAAFLRILQTLGSSRCWTAGGANLELLTATFGATELQSPGVANSALLVISANAGTVDITHLHARGRLLQAAPPRTPPPAWPSLLCHMAQPLQPLCPRQVREQGHGPCAQIAAPETPRSGVALAVACSARCSAHVGGPLPPDAGRPAAAKPAAAAGRPAAAPGAMQLARPTAARAACHCYHRYHHSQGPAPGQAVPSVIRHDQKALGATSSWQTATSVSRQRQQAVRATGSWQAPCMPQLRHATAVPVSRWTPECMPLQAVEQHAHCQALALRPLITLSPAVAAMPAPRASTPCKCPTPIHP